MSQSPTLSAHDPLSSRSAPDTYWSRTNAAEQSPGVLTPLGWTVWGPACEYSCRRAFVAIGAAPKALMSGPAREEDRAYSVFFGRTAINVNFLMQMCDWLPGTNGAAAAADLLNFVPDDVVSTPSRRRYPLVAARMPRVFAGIPRTARQTRAATEQWYRTEIERIPRLGLAEATSAFVQAKRRLDHNLSIQTVAVLCGYQPVFDQLEKLAASCGVEPGLMLRGYGDHAEAQIVRDLWACSRGRLGLDGFIARHGYHGPEEGALHTKVWREDPSPVRRIVETYRSLPDSDDPTVVLSRHADERAALERRLIRGLPVAKRPSGRAVLRLAHVYLPLRGVGKASFLQPLDVTRSAARRIGTCLAQTGVLAESEDVFFLTADELAGLRSADVGELIAARRESWNHHRTLDLPDNWQGTPTAHPIDGDVERMDETSSLTGTGASPGIVEGTVRVITDPADADIEPGQILVAHTTDPSWVSVMYFSAALVVDIGGTNSHAAVVARELGIPCVIGTKHGTRVLRDGDRVRVDGSAGTVELAR